MIMKVGLSININVSKIDKSRLFQGEKGTYLDLTTFVDLDNKDQYGQNGIVKQSEKKGEKADLPILGGVKLFWEGESQQSNETPPQQSQGQGIPQNNQREYQDDAEDD